MTLYTKDDCEKCDKVKNAFDLDGLGINIQKINNEDPEMLAHLAWHELLDVIEAGAMPILLLDDGTFVSNVVPIRKYIKQNLVA
jgi:glutaredoxin 2